MQGHPVVAEHLYVVESIIGKKVVDGKPYYRVKWEGYPETDSTWEKPAHLRYVADMVKDYERTLSLSTDHPDTSEEHPAIPTPSSDDTDPDPPALTSIVVPQEQSSNEEQDQPITPRKLPQEGQGTQTQEKEERRPTRSAIKDKKRKKKTEDRKEDPMKPQAYPRSQKKDAKRLKQLRKEEESTRSPVVAQQEQEKKDKQGVIVKREETDVRIRLIVSQDDSDIRDYVVQYPTGTTRILDTCQLFYTHPIEFVGYLEKRTALRSKK